MSKCKVLVVEDEFLIALNLKQNLEKAGYNVCGTAAEGLEAVELAKVNDPAVVLMDINLRGEIDGIEAARLIGKFSSALIIFTTGYQDQSLKERAMELKPAAYLIKPVSMSDIETIIESRFE